MNYSKLLACVLAVLGLATMCAKCEAGNTTNAIYNGAVIGPSNYGLYKATSHASNNCYWVVVIGNTIALRGGKFDAIVAGGNLKGGTLKTTCGAMTRVA